MYCKHSIAVIIRMRTSQWQSKAPSPMNSRKSEVVGTRSVGHGSMWLKRSST